MTNESASIPGDSSPPVAVPSAAAVERPWPTRVDAFLARLVVPPVLLTPAQTLTVVGVAAGLGVWLDVLFEGEGAGLNVPLWLGSAVAAVVVTASRFGRPLARDRLVVLGTAVALSMVMAWRQSPALQVFGILGAIALVVLGVGLPAMTAVRRVSPVSCAVALASGVAVLLTAPWRAVDRLPWNDVRRMPRGEQAVPLLRAVVIAAPLLFVFGALFVAADAVFADGVSRIFAFDLSAFVPHTMRTLFGASLALAMLWGAASVEAPADLEVRVPERLWLRRLEVGLILGRSRRCLRCSCSCRCATSSAAPSWYRPRWR